MQRESLTEHLSFESLLNLRQACARIRRALSLPDFSYDHENETRWGFAVRDHVEYNVSRPYEKGTLQAWDSSVPDGCNFGVSLSVYREHEHAGDHEWAMKELVAPFIQLVTPVLGATPVHHRTWYPVVGD